MVQNIIINLVGSFGDISTWSFCQDKIISTGGEGGMISTNNKKIWKKCWSSKDHGKNYYSVFHKKHKLGFKWLHDNYGSNYRMTEFQAVIGRYQLKYLDAQIKKEIKLQKKIINSLKLFWSKYNLISEPNFKELQKIYACFLQIKFYINIQKKDKIKLLKYLQKKKINCNEGPCPEIYKEKIFQKSKIRHPKKLSNAVLGNKSIAYHINPFIKSDKLKSDIMNLKKIFLEFI